MPMRPRPDSNMAKVSGSGTAVTEPEKLELVLEVFVPTKTSVSGSVPLYATSPKMNLPLQFAYVPEVGNSGIES